MKRKSISSFAGLAMMLAASIAFAGGPPSFSFEAPPQGSNAVLVVHANACHMPTDAAVTARAEGIVNGQRKSIPLKLTPTGSIGVYAVSRQWPTEGAWVLTFRIWDTTALVKLEAKDGSPMFEVAQANGTRPLNAGCVRTVNGKVTSKDVDAALASNVR